MFYTDNLYAQNNISQNKSGNIFVDAEGVGATKEEAINLALTESIRQAVGAYLVAETTLETTNLDTDIKELIISNSRGSIVSYIELFSKQKNDYWQVKIRAEIKNEILREAAGSVFQMFSKVSNKSLVDDALKWQQEKENEQKQIDAQVYTKEQQKNNANALVDYFLEKFDMSNILTLVSTEESIDKNEGNLVVSVTAKFNTDFYNDLFKNRFSTLLKQVSYKMESNHFDNSQIEVNRIYEFNDKNIDNTPYYEKSYKTNGVEKRIFITEDFSKYTVYYLDREIYSKILNYIKNNITDVDIIIETKIFSKDNQLLDANVKSFDFKNVFYIDSRISEYIIIYPRLGFFIKNGETLDNKGNSWNSTYGVTKKPIFNIPLSMKGEQVKFFDHSEVTMTLKFIRKGHVW
jgi:hypothetical protein